MRTTPKKAHEGQARAKFNFVAQTNLELSLAKGETAVARSSLSLIQGNKKMQITFQHIRDTCPQANWWF